MNSKRIRSLEKYVLPEKPSEAFISVKDEAEIALMEKANNIKLRYRDEVKSYVFADVPLDEQELRAKEIYDTISPDERLILDKDAWFMKCRIADLLYKMYESYYSGGTKSTLLSRIHWILNELEVLGNIETIIDYDFNHRNEDAPDFDDFKWWDNMEKKLDTLYPNRAFTEKSYIKYERILDDLTSQYISEYYQKHPEELEKLNNAKTLKDL